MERIYQEYKERAEFLLVYIREIHPDREFEVLKNGALVREKIAQPQTFEERRELARQFLDTLQITIPTVVDQIDDAVNRSYNARTDRLVIVKPDGRIAYYGAPGPRGFKPKEVEEWLAKNAPPLD